MNVTREIVRDLLPLYVSGEASADSGALVESFLLHDPELARLADALRAEVLPPTRDVSASPGAELKALAQTKGFLRRRTWTLALALFFTALPLSFSADGSGLQFLLLRDAPVLSSVSLAAGLVLWLGYAATVRRLRVTGL